MISRFLSSAVGFQSAIPVLIDAALKGAILVGLAAAAAYLLRKRSAASRHAVWTAAVIGHLAIPVLVVVLPAWRVAGLPALPWTSAESLAPASASMSSQSIAAAADEGADLAVAQTPAASTPQIGESQARAQESIQAGATANRATGSKMEIIPVDPATTNRGTAATISIVATIWMFGAMLVLLRLAIGTWRVTQLAREGARVEDGKWLSLTQRLANTLGVTRPLTLLRGERLAVPVTWGIVYPAVLLPEDADEWPEERRRFVLVHEMAHVKRFDALTQLVAQLAVAIFWFDPLVWIAAHRMRVEREHACDDYVLRDGTTPSLYAGELLEMVRSIGTPTRDRAAPAFAALAMARRSEFEGRMLAILDPRQDRHTLHPRGTFMTAIALVVLALPLAALRPYQAPIKATDEFPESFKVSIHDASQPPGTPAVSASPAAQTTSAATVQTAKQVSSAFSATTAKSRWSCEAYPVGTVLKGTSSHINAQTDENGDRYDFLVSEPGRCTEAALIGKAVFSPDETRITQLSPGSFARFREQTTTADRAVSVVPLGDGSLSYIATLNGRPVGFDQNMAQWLSGVIPRVLRELGINVPERVARLRAQGGVPAVLQEISEINSGWAKRVHYEELIKRGPKLSEADAERVAEQVGRDLTSSGDLSAVMKMLPRSAVQSPRVRGAVAGALNKIQSSGDKVSALEFLAPNADPDMLLVLARAAEGLPSSGDKANFLLTTEAEYLTPRNSELRTAFFRTAATLQSSGDMANVLMASIPYAHADPNIVYDIVDGAARLRSSGDAANVLLSLVSQRALTPELPRATMAAIERTMTMQSSGDRANVLIAIASAKLLTNSDLRDGFSKAAMALPSEGDRSNVLAAAARQ
jgi:beta-lactamase regulating signal transducer with metallopeptidase domain